MHSLGAPHRLDTLPGQPFQHSVHLGASQPRIHLRREGLQGPVGYPGVLLGEGKGGKAGTGPGQQAGWVCGQEAVKHSEVREVPETGVQLGG